MDEYSCVSDHWAWIAAFDVLIPSHGCDLKYEGLLQVYVMYSKTKHWISDVDENIYR